MSRLIDRMYAGRVRPPGRNPESIDIRLIDRALMAEVFAIDNVASYYFARDWTGCITEFPNVALPYDGTFMEFRLPACGPRIGPRAVGVFLTGYPEANHLSELKAFCRDAGQLTLEDGDWLIQGVLFTEQEKYTVVGPVVSWYIVANALGKPQGYFAMMVGWEKDHFKSESEAELMTRDLTHLALFPSLLALSFLHCKNVTVTTNEPPVKLARAYEKEHKRPLVRYKTLEIEPIKQILRHEGKSEETGLKHALHICRGHFKDYTERGLFGRNKGLYWWESHVRGTLEKGAVIKDYEVKRP